MKAELPTIDLTPFLHHGQDHAATCQQVADMLERFGVLIIKDPRLPLGLDRNVRELMVAYFQQPEDRKREDERPELHHEVGWTPPFTEFARPRPEAEARLIIKPGHNASPGDPKERFMCPIGGRPKHSKYGALNAAPVIPKAFFGWQGFLEEWGNHMLQAVFTVCRMAAVGFGEDPDLFANLLTHGPHLFAPTGSDLSKHGAAGTVLAEVHDDLGFMTGHGPSNYPLLFCWTRDGKRLQIRVPDGCLLLQAGQQFQCVTGGRVLAGLHEVVVTEETAPAIMAEITAGKTPWRVSTTLFVHVRSDELLQPMSSFATGDALAAYPPIEAGQHVMDELKLLGLAAQEPSL